MTDVSVQLYSRHVGVPPRGTTEGHQDEVSIQSSVNLGKIHFFE